MHEASNSGEDSSLIDQENISAIRQFNVGPGLLQDFETGALLHAILAWPNPADEDELKTAAAALCASVIDVTLQKDPSRRQELELAFPEYIAMDRKTRERAERMLHKRLNHRMAAARMSLGFFAEGLSGEAARLPSGMTRLSIDQLSRLVLSDVYISDPQNIEKLVWRQSLPVLHLAATFQVIGRQRQPDTDSFNPKLDDIALYRNIVNQASVHEQIMLADPRFGKRRNDLIRIRWID